MNCNEIISDILDRYSRFVIYEDYESKFNVVFFYSKNIILDYRYVNKTSYMENVFSYLNYLKPSILQINLNNESTITANWKLNLIKEHNCKLIYDNEKDLQ